MAQPAICCAYDGVKQSQVVWQLPTGRLSQKKAKYLSVLAAGQRPRNDEPLPKVQFYVISMCRVDL